MRYLPVMLIIAAIALSACGGQKPESGLVNKALFVCQTQTNYSQVSFCGDYVKVELNNIGGGIRWIKKDSSIIECPVVGPDSMSKECKALLDNPPVCTKTKQCRQPGNAS